ncbi:MAG: glycosyltransferase family 9 protein [Leptolyngbya sp.]|nr:glycosyltransferase family 9 protein [Leptolyngbya sp.]
MRVLALVPGGIERQLEFFPVLREIKQAVKAAEIAVVVDPEAKEIYQLSKVVSEVVPYSFRASNSPADWANLLGIVRDREFEAVITCTESWSIGLLLWLSGIPTRIGYAGGSNGWFLTTLIPQASDSADDAAFLRALNVTSALAPPSLNLPQADLKAVETLRRGAKLQGGYVAVYAGATADGEAYPTEAWMAILQDFQQRQPDLPLVLLQTADTVANNAALRQALPGITVLEPDTLGQLAALIAGANLLVAVQGYPIALAAALEVYTVGLSADPVAAPPGAGNRFVNVAATTGKLADLDPATVLQTIWKG